MIRRLHLRPFADAREHLQGEHATVKGAVVVPFAPVGVLVFSFAFPSFFVCFFGSNPICFFASEKVGSSSPHLACRCVWGSRGTGATEATLFAREGSGDFYPFGFLGRGFLFFDLL
uniref:Predicted protein n=1 Tax=Hordeum vulgare subsp. vulgare TaxID=112509 RepID=F2DN87_HORVV|nr:predicted protein [Hordeum vulgare subsp. vulgare]